MDVLKDDLLKTRGIVLSTELGDMDQLDERIRDVKVSAAWDIDADRSVRCAVTRGAARGIDVDRCIRCAVRRGAARGIDKDRRIRTVKRSAARSIVARWIYPATSPREVEE